MPAGTRATINPTSMKRLSFLLLFVYLLTSCKAPYFYIGMQEKEFLRHNRVQIIQTSVEQSTYKKINYPFGAPPVTKFFYFQHGVLVEVNEGERNPDVIIEKRVR